MSRQSFPPQLQKEIDAATAELARLQRQWPPELSLRLGSGAQNLYDCYPHLFTGAFPLLSSEEVRPLALAGRLFATSIFLGDRLMDRSSSARTAPIDCVRVQVLQLEAHRLLQKMFPPEAAFWDRFRLYWSEYATACLHEQQFAFADRDWKDFSQQAALSIAAGKNGIARAVVAGLVELAQDEHLLEPLSSAIDEFNIACQMWDDLQDWKEDLLCGQPSLLLSRVLSQWPAPGGARDVESLAREIHYGGHSAFVLELALGSLDRAEAWIADLPELPWRRFLGDLRRQCQGFLGDLGRIVGSNLDRVGRRQKQSLDLPAPGEPWQALAWDGLRFVLRQWELGFGEARHIMRFPAEQGFGSRTEYQYGDVFQRALLADALCDASDPLQGQLKSVLDQELQYLLSRRRAGGIGGWSYFPDLPELPPDADDLAQILCLLVRTGHRAQAAEHCEMPLACLLQDNAHGDGSFETWIVPATGRTPEQELQHRFVLNAWGSGPDSDVIANLLYALDLYAPQRFEQVVHRGTAYLETQQEADGSWQSTWYHGPFYGTYACLRLFAAVRPDSEALQAGLGFIRSRQHTDGGWGLDDASDPLSTALALLALAAAPGAEDSLRAEKALGFLRRTQELDLSWPSCRFIRMELGRASGAGHTILSYGSATVTSAFVLKAALAWHRRTSETTPCSSSKAFVA